MIFVARVRRGVSISLATPKSVSRAGCEPPGPSGPCMSSRMFSGLTSRWTTPAACAAARPSATSATIATAASGASRRSRSRRVRRSVPRTRSMTSARSLPSTTRSRTATTLRVVEAEQRGALLDEAADQLLVGREVLAQQLDGDGPLGSLAQPHRAGAAPPQDLVGGVPAADLPCQDCSLSGCALPHKATRPGSRPSPRRRKSPRPTDVRRTAQTSRAPIGARKSTGIRRKSAASRRVAGRTAPEPVPSEPPPRSADPVRSPCRDASRRSASQ